MEEPGEKDRQEIVEMLLDLPEDSEGEMILEHQRPFEDCDNFRLSYRLKMVEMRSGYCMNIHGEWIVAPKLFAGNPEIWSSKGRSKDRDRLVRCRSPYKRYNPALDIPEIFDRIMAYVHDTHPRSAMWFARALENLGSMETLEYDYLVQSKVKKGYQSRTSVGKFRSILMGDKHCGDCATIMKNKGKNTISDVPRCWVCMIKRFPLVEKKKAQIILCENVKHGTFNSNKKLHDFLDQILARLPRMYYFSKTYYEKNAVKMAANVAQKYFDQKKVMDEVNREKEEELMDLFVCISNKAEELKL